MLIILNLVIVLLVLLIAYWWANQGVFSALLHLVCVVTAGAIALALWEPITLNLLMRGGAFDDYAWGASLIAIFCLSLVILRVAMDKLAPGNINLPQSANLICGFPVGAASGVLTIGILMTGVGFIQSHQELMGYTGYGRSARTAEVGRTGGALWLPAHQWTIDFYEYVSLGSLYPTFNNTPLAHYNPELYKQASLVRDSYNFGQAKLSLIPDAAEVISVQRDEQNNRHAVEIEFKALARDFGDQLTLSSSQIRLITRPAGGSVRVIHPDEWVQETQEGGNQRFRFDDVSHYITSIPGRESTRVTIEFPVPSGMTARFIQVRGTRFALPQATPVPPGTLGTGTAQPTGSADRVVLGTAPSIQNEIRVSNDIRPMALSSNQLPGTISHHDRYLTRGTMTYRSGGDRPMRNLMIRGVEEPQGTKIVQLDVSRGTRADIFGPVRNQVGEDAALSLVDSRGNTYSPIGYLHEHREGTSIRLEPGRFIRTAEELPVLPTSGTDRLRLLFRVTMNSTIVAFQYGDVTVGTCELPVR